MKGGSGQGDYKNTFPGLQKQGEVKAEWEAARAPVGEGGRRSPLRGMARVWDGKTLLEDSVFLLMRPAQAPFALDLHHGQQHPQRAEKAGSGTGQRR